MAKEACEPVGHEGPFAKQKLVTLCQGRMQSTYIRGDGACDCNGERIAGSGGHMLAVANESAGFVKKRQREGGGEIAGEDRQILGFHASFWTIVDTVGAAGIAGNACICRVVLIDEAIEAGATSPSLIAQGRLWDLTAGTLFTIVLCRTGAATSMASRRTTKVTGYRYHIC